MYDERKNAEWLSGFCSLYTTRVLRIETQVIFLLLFLLVLSLVSIKRPSCPHLLLQFVDLKMCISSQTFFFTIMTCFNLFSLGFIH